MLGNEDAVSLLEHLGRLSQVADDIADGDAKGPEPMSDLLLYALDVIPRNRFYREHVGFLHPVFTASVLMWEASNDFAKSESRDVRLFGFVLREAMDQVIVIAALLLGGLDHARHVARDVVLFYHGEHAESFEAWESEMGHG